ncbi:MAG: ABC transporter substrate-binding protein [Clostridiales Family XIII bacterium]|jgi:ABC-type nitrate/sulfonate/bicarbonate transport system substrate-binding protein|nr:ABC transporter substrate-binding protein [Clostridiales Family XIII bacterium]
MKTQKRKTGSRTAVIFLALILAFGALGLTACGGSSDDSTSADAGGDTTVIKLSGLGGDPTRVDAAIIAQELGYFAEEGLEVEDVGVIDIPQHVSAVASGTVDTISLMTSEGLTAVDGGADIVQVATDQTTTEDKQHMTFLVLPDSDIKTGTDLAGKRIGTASASGGCTAGFPLEYIRQAGTDVPIEDIRAGLQSIPEETLVTALEAGDTDAIGVHLTKAQTEILYPDLRVLFTDYDILGEDGGDTGWFFTREYTEENPETVTKFIRAITKAQKWINENNEEALDIYREKAIAVNDDLLWVAHFSDDGINNPAGAQTWIDLFSSGDSSITLKNKDIKVEDFTTDEFNPNK